ncbi:unnamed protein product [Camellia sinensis]
MASSSVPSSSRPQYTYDVFLSFRGEDTRDNIVSHFYTLLAQKGINTFKDDEKLERGKVISPELRRAIRESRFSIVFLSKNYASSRWCLDELVEALECNNTTVIPIFYHVDPSEVKRQRGSFGEGFDELISKQGVLGMENVQRWRKALEEVGNISGWHYPSDTFRKVIELLGLGMGDARAVGIWGMGGIGKTTISRAVYDCISYQFQGCSFIENVREVSEKCGLKTLQEQLISEILMAKDFKVRSDAHAVHMIRNMICRKKVLIVLDDVDESTNLEKLVGEHNCLNSGSRIIITTQNKHVFSRYGITHIYEVEELREDEAMELFKSKAFGNYQHMEGYQELVRRAVKYANGVPLALKVLGSFLRGRNEDEWESSLNRLKKSPPKEVRQVLRISYEALESEEQDIFLDIACFFKGKDKNEVIKILESCGFDPIIGIDVLVQKSLITISSNKLLMHDLIQQLGWCIVIQQSREEPGERTRLWRDEDIKNVLMNNTGTNKVEDIVMQYNGLSDGTMHLDKLRIMNFSHSTFLKKSPNFAGVPNLERLILEGCTGLVNLHPSIGVLKRLICLNLKDCKCLKSLPDNICQLKDLGNLNLSGCSKLDKLPQDLGVLDCLYELYADWTATRQLPSPIGRLKNLGVPTLKGSLIERPISIVQRDASRFKIGFPGREIPKWFSHQGRGPSISFQLPPHWFNNRFLGFAFATVGLKKVESAFFGIKMRWKCYVTKRIITLMTQPDGNILVWGFPRDGDILVWGIPRYKFLPFTEDCMEELNKGGIEVEVEVEVSRVRTVSNLTSKELVEKVGVHVIYKEAEEQTLTSIYNSQDNNNINMDVFHGDLDRSAGVQVGSSSSSATTSKRRRDDDLNDNHYDAAAAAAASGSPGIDDQEDHLNNLNSKRLRKCSYVQLEGGVYKQGTRWALVRRIRDVNDCLLVKWWRRFGSEGNGLWKRLICSIYSVERGRWFPSYGANSSFSRIWSGLGSS